MSPPPLPFSPFFLPSRPRPSSRSLLARLLLALDSDSLGDFSGGNEGPSKALAKAFGHDKQLGAHFASPPSFFGRGVKPSHNDVAELKGSIQSARFFSPCCGHHPFAMPTPKPQRPTPLKAPPRAATPTRKGKPPVRASSLQRLKEFVTSPSKSKSPNAPGEAKWPVAATERDGTPIPTPPGQKREGPSSRVTVAVRIKPTPTAKTLMRFGLRSENALRFGGLKNEEPKTFAYDHVFDESDSQSHIYEMLGAGLLEKVINGYNASAFAYGQTGSGKTYTMLGTPEERGLIPRLCEGLFQERSLLGWSIKMTCFEIYNEQVIDLLAVREEPEGEKQKQDEWKGCAATTSIPMTPRPRCQ